MSTRETEKDQQVHLDDQGNMKMEKKEPRTSGRLHVKTQKEHELYLENLNKQKSKLAKFVKELTLTFLNLLQHPIQQFVLVKVSARTEVNLKKYEKTYHECCEYL